ncbi:MAG: hypothetical protein ACK5MQ_08900, partial [Pikeienuella sp.]
MRRPARYAAAALALGAPSPAAAHLVGVEFGEFYAGAMHVLLGPEFLAALIALARAAALLRERVGRWALVVAPLAMAVGAYAGAALGGSDFAAALAACAALGGFGAVA